MPKPTIKTLIDAGQRQPAQPLPSYDDVLAYANQLPATAQPPAPGPSPVAPAPYTYATPDPMAQAQQLADRQHALNVLTSPVTPASEIPSDIAEALAKVKSFFGFGGTKK